MFNTHTRLYQQNTRVELTGYMRLSQALLKRHLWAAFGLSTLGLSLTLNLWGLIAPVVALGLIVSSNTVTRRLLAQCLLASSATLFAVDWPVLAGLTFGLAVVSEFRRTSVFCGVAFGVFVGALTSPIAGIFATCAALLPLLSVFTEQKALERSLLAFKKSAERVVRYRGQIVELNRFLPSQASRALASGKTVEEIRHRRRHLIVFFSDIEGFAARSDQMDAASISRFLNTYLTSMAEIVERHGGVLNKFMGDGIMVTFGDDADSLAESNAANAAAMALEMQAWVDAQPKAPSDPPLRVRIGMASGFCTIGTFGAPSRLEYTAIGRQVNLAARLEQVAEPKQILVTEALYRLLSTRFEFAKAVEVQLKGFREVTQSYALLAPLTDATSERSEAPATALNGLD